MVFGLDREPVCLCSFSSAVITVLGYCVKILVATCLLFCSAWIVPVHAVGPEPSQSEWPGAEGILSRVRNAQAVEQDGTVLLTRKDATKPIILTFVRCQAVGVHRDQDA